MVKLTKKDWAELQTDKYLDEIEKQVVKEYKQAYEEVKGKCDEYLSKFQEQDKQKLLDLNEGKITEEQYEQWRLGKMFTGQRWQDLTNMLANDLVLADKKALSIVNGYLPQAYADSFNYATYDVEKNMRVNTSFTLYDRRAVERLLRENPNLLPKRKVDVPADKRWNKRHINSAITQGVLQGDSIDKVATRLQQVTDMDRRAAIRNARTMMTGTHNSGKMDAFERAVNLGIEVKKWWRATLDSRTRDSHGKLDGEIRELDEKFSNGLMYPGDPDGAPQEVYNCRCKVLPYYPEHQPQNHERYVQETGEEIQYMTYSEWANSRAIAK